MENIENYVIINFSVKEPPLRLKRQQKIKPMWNVLREIHSDKVTITEKKSFVEFYEIAIDGEKWECHRLMMLESHCLAIWSNDTGIRINSKYLCPEVLLHVERELKPFFDLKDKVY